MPVFFPPELAAQVEMEGLASSSFNGRADLMRELYFQRTRQGKKDPELDRKLVNLVLDHAKRVIAHPSRPQRERLESFIRSPFSEIALEETLEETPFLDEVENILVRVKDEKPFSCVAILDSSSSMSGEKHLLASIGVAVLLLQVQSKDASVVVFSSDASAIKRLKTEDSVEATVLRFLRSQPKGFTNIRKGLEEGLAQYGRSAGTRRRVGLLASDGRTTEGGDPVEIAKKFDFLVVLHLHGPGSHLEASQELASAGNGVCLEVETFEELPRRLYDAVKLLARR